MPDLFTILTVAILIAVVVALIVATISKRRREIKPMDTTFPNPTELPTNPSEIIEPVDSIEPAAQTTYEEKPSQSTDSLPTPLVETNPNTEENEQVELETTNDPEESPKPIIIDSQEASKNPPTNGLSKTPSSTAESSSQVTNDETESDLNSPAKSGRRISPENRGGARRGKRTKETEEPRSDKKRRVRKPELVCWQQSRKWFLGVETLTENGETSDVAATQANAQLTKVLNSRWLISDLFETVTITTLSTNEKYDLQLAEEQNPFLLFKLSGESLNNGRRVRYATLGIYLVVIPQDWIRDEQQSGVSPVPPSHCHLNGFQAHYFYLDSANDERIAFLTPEKKPILIPNRNSHFEIRGCKIDDANDETSSLFGQSPLSLTTNDAAIWRNAETIVIGEEGKTANGWRTWFKPEIEDGQVDVLQYLQGKEAGWFFLRIYDPNDEMIDSLDFRFARSLRAIRIDEHSIFPSETGHKSVRITLEYNDSSSGELLPSAHNLKPEKVNENKIEIVVPPEPEYDRTEWAFVSSTKAGVNISLLVERIWWTICKTATPLEQSEWQDNPLALRADHLKATSEYVLRIRLPKPRWTKEVRIGFERRRARIYPVEVAKHIVDLPMNHLEGVGQLEDSSKDHPLILWLDGFPQQIIALLSSKQRKQKAVREKSKTQIRLNLSRLLKYLHRLDRWTKDASLSELISECTSKWSSSGIREHRDTYLIETACVIALSWKLLKAKRIKVVGRRKGWIRHFIRIAESNPSSFSLTVEKYQTLTGDDKVT